MANFEKDKNAPIKILYPGYLPAFSPPGAHPQFRHLADPPSGYKFVYVSFGKAGKIIHFLSSTLMYLFSAFGNKLRRQKVWESLRSKNVSRLKKFYYFPNPLSDEDVISIGFIDLLKAFPKILVSAINLSSSAVRSGARLKDVLRFILSRDILSQLYIPINTRLAFLPTCPHILSQVPWVIEIEEVLTLFSRALPYEHMDTLPDSFDILSSPYYPCVKALIESDNCKGIICHVKSTAEAVPLIFQNDALRKKTFHIALGVRLPPIHLLEGRERDGVIRILFTNSWNPWNEAFSNFYLRGGLDVLEAFSILSSRYPNLRLILRTSLPPDLDKRYLKIIKTCPVEVVDQFLSEKELQKLKAKADIFVLPSARLHVVSVVEAMAYGSAIVVSDGWGMQEYIEHGRNGIVIPGRFGKCSWVDKYGAVRVNYKPLFSSDPVIVKRLVEFLSTLIEDKDLRKKLGWTARKDAESKFSLENWNRYLKKAFDQAFS